MGIRGGYTLLQVAAEYNDNVEVAKFLVDQGVSVDATLKEFGSAADIAERHSHPQVAAYLRGLHRDH